SQYHVAPASFVVFGSSVLFTGGDPNSGSSVLYKLDPASDTIQILAGAQFNSSYQSSIAVMNGFALFVGRDSALWRTDGTITRTSALRPCCVRWGRTLTSRSTAVWPLARVIGSSQ